MPRGPHGAGGHLVGGFVVGDLLRLGVPLQGGSVQLHRDIEQVAPIGREFVDFWSAESNTAFIPYIVIEYARAGMGKANAAPKRTTFALCLARTVGGLKNAPKMGYSIMMTPIII